jgi:lipopolysaccharide heptosyltransferase I
MSARILIVRLGSLGDLVHTLPAVAALRRTFPGMEIDWLVDRPHRGFLELVPAVTSLVVLESRGAGGWIAARRRMRARRYDLALDFQGLLKSAALARLSGATRVIGFERAALREPQAAWFYRERVAADEGGHVIDKNLRLAQAAGATPGPLEFPIRTVRSPRVEAFVAGLPGPYALINPGAAWPNKRWPPDRLAAIARHLRDQHGLASVVLWGPGEADAANAVVGGSGGAAHLAPPTGLPDLVALARGARLMVSGDTGPLHITSALGVPAVALFGPTNPLRNGPWDPEDISLSEYSRCDCHYERRCRRGPAGWCLGRIGTGDVVQAVETRLRRAGAVAQSRQI